MLDRFIFFSLPFFSPSFFFPFFYLHAARIQPPRRSPFPPLLLPLSFFLF